MKRLLTLSVLITLLITGVMPTAHGVVSQDAVRRPITPLLSGGVAGVSTTVIFVDGVAHMTSPDDKWPETTSNPSIATGVTGAHGRVYDLAANNLIRNLGQNLASLSSGQRWQIRVDATQDILLFRDTASTTQVKVRYNAGGSFDVLRNTTVLDSTAAGLVAINTWFYLEMGSTIDNTTGSVTVKIYNDSLTLLDTLTFSGDTQNTANAFANHIILAGSACDAYVEDIWVASTNVSYGPLRVETLYPTGNGASNPFARGGADSGANWSQVDEAQNNDNTDFITSSTVGDIDLFTFPSRSLTGAIHAVQITAVAQRESASTTVMRHVARVAGSNFAGSNKTLTSAWIAHVHAMGVNPNTSAAWNSSELIGFQGGVEVVSVTASVDVQVTQVVLEILTAP